MGIRSRPMPGEGASLPIQEISNASSFAPVEFSGANVLLGQNIEISLSGMPTSGKIYSFYIESSGNYTLTFSTDFDLTNVEYNHVFSSGDTATLIFVGANTGGLKLSSASRGGD